MAINVSIISPFYNETDVVKIFCNAVFAEMAKHSGYSFELICIDDGSGDETVQVLLEMARAESRVKIIEFSRNFGKEAAITAGLNFAKGDLVIVIDSDLQDPPYLISKLLEAWMEKSCDVVLAKRSDRTSDSHSKRFTASLFYTIINWLSEIKIPENVGDCRLMTRPVVDAINKMPENQRFMKGLFAWVGFKTVVINYSREVRVAGASKFSAWKLWNFALEGVTGFSTIPLRIWLYVGLFGAVTTFLYAFYIVARTLFTGVDVPGYASLMVSILFFGSLQLIGLGVLGEYVGRAYMEAKKRPLFVIRNTYGL